MLYIRPSPGRIWLEQSINQPPSSQSSNVMYPPLSWLHSLTEFILTIRHSTSFQPNHQMSEIHPPPGCTTSQNLPTQSIIQPPSSQFIKCHRSAHLLAALPRRVYLNNPSFNLLSPLSWLHSLAQFTLTINHSTAFHPNHQMSYIHPTPGCTPSKSLP
jgi:hypothetical protein